ncbi:hypothetical protein F4809DRAFT_646234 [Biscogniauxia mediterranea]|nr:hypothetical protein F4809DRAFT_646234 [Biscogniauxia mediterranea]
MASITCHARARHDDAEYGGTSPASSPPTSAGRSPSKLAASWPRTSSKPSTPSRAAPSIHVLPDLSPLARRTAALINGAGPYHRHSSPVVAACAGGGGTYYVDFTTETPWVAVRLGVLLLALPWARALVRARRGRGRIERRAAGGRARSSGPWGLRGVAGRSRWRRRGSCTVH